MPADWMEHQLAEQPSLRDVLGVVSGEDLKRKVKAYAVQVDVGGVWGKCGSRCGGRCAMQNRRSWV